MNGDLIYFLRYDPIICATRIPQNLILISDESEGLISSYYSHHTPSYFQHFSILHACIFSWNFKFKFELLNDIPSNSLPFFNTPSLFWYSSQPFLCDFGPYLLYSIYTPFRSDKPLGRKQTRESSVIPLFLSINCRSHISKKSLSW